MEGGECRMKTSNFAEGQTEFAFLHDDLGTPVTEACRNMRISEATYFRWKQNRVPESVNAAAVPAADGVGHQAEPAGGGCEPRQVDAARCVDKNSLGPARRPAVIRWLQDHYRVSECSSCAAMHFDRSTHRDRPVRHEREPLR